MSYRRSDSAMAGRIFDRLVQHFGKSNPFIDIDNVPFGVDFRKHIDDALQTSDLLIAMSEQLTRVATRRQVADTNAADPVRVELETALRRELIVLPLRSTAPRCRTRPSELCSKRARNSPRFSDPIGAGYGPRAFSFPGWNDCTVSDSTH